MQPRAEFIHQKWMGPFSNGFHSHRMKPQIMQSIQKKCGPTQRTSMCDVWYWYISCSYKMGLTKPHTHEELRMLAADWLTPFHFNLECWGWCAVFGNSTNNSLKLSHFWDLSNNSPYTSIYMSTCQQLLFYQCSTVGVCCTWMLLQSLNTVHHGALHLFTGYNHHCDLKTKAEGSSLNWRRLTPWLTFTSKTPLGMVSSYLSSLLQRPTGQYSLGSSVFEWTHLSSIRSPVCPP